jgi:hypothetical protein
MIRKIKELSKNELINFIYNNVDNFKIDSKIDCACCGSPDADWYIICDECDKALQKD